MSEEMVIEKLKEIREFVNRQIVDIDEEEVKNEIYKVKIELAEDKEINIVNCNLD